MPEDRRRDDSRPGDPAEGVRIIGAEEAAEAIERGDVASRRGGDIPRYGDRPARPPAGPKPALRFPLDPGSDVPDASLRPAKGTRFDPQPEPAWDDPQPIDEDEGDPWPADTTWGDVGEAWDESASDDVVAWTSGEAEAADAPAAAADPAAESLSWAEDFVGEEDPWDGSWDEPTGAVRWADDGPAAPAADADAADAVDPPDASDEARPVDPTPSKRRGLFRRTREQPVVDPTDAPDEPVVDLSDGAVGPGDPTLLTDAPGPPAAGAPDAPDAAERSGAASDDDAGGAPGVTDDATFDDDDPWPAEDDDEAWAARTAEPTGGLFDEDGGWAEPAAPVFDFGDEPSGQVELPHWTEPATGELPRVLADDDSGTASTTTGAHWRTHDAAWSADDFGDLADDVRVGALDVDRPHDEDLYSFDELDVPVDDAAPDEPRRRVPPARPAAPSGGGGGGRAGRDLGVATAVGVGAAAVALALFAMGAKFVLALLVVILAAMIGEFQNAVRRAGYRPASLLGIVATVCAPLAVYWKGIEAYPVLMVLTVGAALAWHLVGADGDAHVVESVGVTLLGVAWVGGFGSFAALLLAQQDGRGMLIAAILAAVGYDVGGLAIGRTMGARPLSDASPNKTVEGLVGGMIVSISVTFIVVGLFGIAPFDGPGAALKIGFVAALAAPLGDLCESLVKRDLGIKDMGSVLPEHGGVLDRFDALLFVLPAVFYGAVLFGLGPF